MRGMMLKRIGTRDVDRLHASLSGQVISADKEDVIQAYYPGFFMQSVKNQIQTNQVTDVKYDDSYQGKRVTSFFSVSTFSRPSCRHFFLSLLWLAGYSIAVGEFTGDQVEGKWMSKALEGRHVATQASARKSSSCHRL